jgi:hypothetical protein
MRITDIVLCRRPQVRLWTCDVFISVTTSQQFTDECHQATATGRWWILALLKGWLAARRKARALATKPGERAAKGWVD